MKYRLFLSDFDGTLVRDDGTISEKNRAAIRRYREAGGIFAIATGRMPAGIVPRLRELGLDGGVVATYQGAVIVDTATGAYLKNDAFPQEDALHIVGLLEAEGYHVHMYTAETMYCNCDDEGLRAYERICGVKAVVVNEGTLASLAKRENLRVVKTLVMVEPERRRETEARVRALADGRYYVTCSSEYLVEVMPAGRSKAEAVEFFSRYYAIPKEEIAAIGDQYNDLPMLQAAGGRFTVQNGENALKEIATVVSSCEEDGVAEAIGIALGDDI